MSKKKCCCGGTCKSAISYSSSGDFVAMDGSTTLSFSSGIWTFNGDIEPANSMSTIAFLLTFTATGSFTIVLDSGDEIAFSSTTGTFSCNGESASVPPGNALINVYVTPSHLVVWCEGFDFAEGFGAATAIIEVNTTGATNGGWHIEGAGQILSSGAQMQDAKYIPGTGYCLVPSFPSWETNWTIYQNTKSTKNPGKFFFEADWTGDSGDRYDSISTEVSVPISFTDCNWLSTERTRLGLGPSDPTPRNFDTLHSGMETAQFWYHQDFDNICQSNNGAALDEVPLAVAITDRPNLTVDIFTHSVLGVIAWTGGTEVEDGVGGYYRCEFTASLSVSWSMGWVASDSNCGYSVTHLSEGSTSTTLSPSGLISGFSFSVTGTESTPVDELRDDGSNPFCAAESDYNTAIAFSMPTVSATWIYPNA